jgi:hypothetical protein
MDEQGPGHSNRRQSGANGRFKCESNSRKSINCFKGMKNTKKIPKLSVKFPEVHWDMNNPNKVFISHEKDFRAF